MKYLIEKLLVVTSSKFASVLGKFVMFCRTWPGSVTNCHWVLPGNFIILPDTWLSNKNIFLFFYDKNNTL